MLMDFGGRRKEEGGKQVGADEKKSVVTSPLSTKSCSCYLKSVSCGWNPVMHDVSIIKTLEKESNHQVFDP